MKKTLIAAAALVATGAFAQVTISGVMDAGYKITDAAVGDNSVIAQNGTATSGFTFGASEDLAGGMKAGARFEINPDFVNGTGLAGASAAAPTAQGYHFVNLSGAFGDVKFGRLNSATLSTHGIANPFGTAVGSGYATMLHRYTPTAATATGLNTAPTRFNGAFQYSTPSLSGFNASLLYVPKVDASDSTAGNKQGVMELGLAYANGPLSVGFAQQTIDEGANALGASGQIISNIGASDKSVLTTLAASYQLSAFKVAVGYSTHKADNGAVASVDTVGMRVSGTFTTGAITAMVTMATSDDKLVADANRTSMGLGVDYALSKTAALYARYEATDTDTTSAADNKTTTTMVGIRKAF